MNRKARRVTAGSDRIAAADAPGPPPLLALAQAACRNGRLEEADGLCVRHLAAVPGHAQALYLRGEVARLGERPSDAIGHFQAALATAPAVAAIHDGLAEAYRSVGQAVEAERHYRRVAELRPGAVTLLNLGNALMDLGRPADAAATYRSALRADARLPELHYALGTALGALQQRQAVDAFARAVALRPDFVPAHEGLVEAWLAAGDPDAALRAACRALGRVDTTRLRVLFVDCVRDAMPTAEMDGLAETMRRALAERWTRPQELARAACTVAALRRPLDPRDEPLHTLLDLAPVCHREVEQALTRQRSALLDAVVSGAVPAGGLATACALARQGFVNEYAWSCTSGETDRVALLCDGVRSALDGGTVPADMALAVIAMYRPLGGLADAERLLDRAWPTEVGALLAQQVREPAEEQRLRGAIRRATPIEDAVSQAVRDQYETNPYPRWMATIDAMQRIRLGDWLRARFPSAPAAPLPEGRILEVLVAGCGTGQHAVETVRGLADVSVLAIDLSLASLAYATRITASLGVGGIEYAQGDLLQAARLGRTFDLIAAGGVLHHMADPWTGWRALLEPLRPGGVMNVLLYTERGRGDVRAARDWIAGQGYKPTPEGIRSCRHDLMARPEDWAVRLSDSPDCCSASGCRDLLFHVQEGAVTLPEVARFLQAEGLRLLGVDVAAATEQAFRDRNPGAGEDALRDLSRWELFEAENPRCFAGMLNLWVQKGPAAAPA